MKLRREETALTASQLPCGSEALLSHFGRIDIYVFDQLLRGHITPEMRVLDAGCGAGRNVAFLMKCGSDVHGIDADSASIERIQALAASAAPTLPSANFTVGNLTDLPYPDAYFGAVLCSAVLHFARDELDFEGMLAEMWRVLEPGGIFFARLASTIGIEKQVTTLAGRRHRLPDGSDRFLVDEAYLARVADALGATLVDPLKTTIVQNMRSMTTWVLRKS